MNTPFLLPLLLLAAAASAEADTLRYEISGQQGLIASFEVDSKPTPDLIGFNDEFFKLTNVAIDYPADPAVKVADISFYARSVDNGMAIYQEVGPNLVTLFDGYGPHLYRGSVQSPTLKTGTFDFDGGEYHVVVSPVGAVPEPSSWALMLAGGVGIAGRAARRGRKTSALPA